MTRFHVTSTTTGIDLIGPKNRYIIDASSVVSVVDDHAFYGDPALYSNKFRVRGVVEAFGSNNAFLIEGLHTRIGISGGGRVSAESTAIELSAEHSSVVNNGTISAGTTAVKLDDIVGFVKNAGTITSDDVAIFIGGRGGEIENYGTITADHAIHQVALAGQTTSTFNAGTITGTSFVFSGSVANDSVWNEGSLEGDVLLFGGHDVFRNMGGIVDGNIDGGRGRDLFHIQSGTISGVISGGAGNDTYRIGVAGLTLNELVDGGRDRVISSVSVTLADNIEMLKLLGTSSISGTGNDGANRIIGNAGANALLGGDGKDVLLGMRGDDKLRGGEGNDRLSGGTGSDIFVFATRGGHDTIVDFKPGMDRINLSHFDAIANFHDMMTHHVRTSGHNAVIEAGTDKLVLLHVSTEDLHSHDFIF